MESRKITIVSTKNQKTTVIMSEASTLAELKRDMRNNNIDYDGMTFYEGTSKTELISDDSVLPHDVPFKGNVTNELVFMLTNTNKKIKSGAMTRLEAYNVIRTKGLQNECLKRFGKNFTMCKTVDLISLIESKNNVKPVEVKVEVKTEKSENTNEVSNLKKAFYELLNVLYDSCNIDNDEKDRIESILKAEECNDDTMESSYSKDDINEMFRDMNI